MRLDQPPFNDKRFRQAISLLIDRQSLVDNLAQGIGAVHILGAGGGVLQDAALHPGSHGTVLLADEAAR
jgi:ABC-type oligopeptide transport system substrate-binding subunit